MKILKVLTWLTFWALVMSSRVPSFLSAVVNQANGRQYERVVVLLRIEEGANTEFFDAIKTEVLRNNPGNSFVISSKREAFQEKLLFSVSFLIATMDSFNFVRYFSGK